MARRFSGVYRHETLRPARFTTASQPSIAVAQGPSVIPSHSTS